MKKANLILAKRMLRLNVYRIASCVCISSVSCTTWQIADSLLFQLWLIHITPWILRRAI